MPTIKEQAAAAVPPVSHGSLPTVRASAATLSAALTLRPRASLATIYETAPNIRHTKRNHPLSRAPSKPGSCDAGRDALGLIMRKLLNSHVAGSPLAARAN